jgi:hypothetical protein
MSALLPATQSTMMVAVRDAGSAVRDSPLNGPAGVALLVLVMLAATAVGLNRLRETCALGLALRQVVRLLLYLWPVGLLTVIYPTASRRMAGHEIGGVQLTTFLLAVALTVPWLSQGVCMPLYRVLGPVAFSGDHEAVRQRFCSTWPTTFVQTLPVLLVFTVPLTVVMRWSPTAIGAYLLLVGLDVAFAQSLVLTNIRHSHLGWALAWTAYAVPVLIVPRAWFLPPLLALITQIIPLRRQLRTRPAWLRSRDTAADVLRGLLLGSILWADKLFYFVKSGNRFPVVTVFLALLPAILAYNYYFICIAPHFDASVARVRASMEKDPISTLQHHSRALAERVSASLGRTALIGAVSVFAISWALAAVEPRRAALIASISVASWLFMMTTLLCYKLDYIGETVLGQLFGGAHFAMCAAAFLLLPAGPVAYFSLAGAELLVFVVVLYVCLKAWRTPEYTLFWRHALAW